MVKIFSLDILLYMVLFVSGFQADAGKFVLFTVGIFCQNVAATGLVYFVGAAVGRFSNAQLIYIVLLVFAMVHHTPYITYHVFVLCVHFVDIWRILCQLKHNSCLGGLVAVA